MSTDAHDPTRSDAGARGPLPRARFRYAGAVGAGAAGAGWLLNGALGPAAALAPAYAAVSVVALLWCGWPGVLALASPNSCDFELLRATSAARAPRGTAVSIYDSLPISRLIGRAMQCRFE